jgi:hypothetical protein
MKYKLSVLLCVLLYSGLNAQQIGFGCLGLVGGYGGYQYQQYKATGLNAYIDDFNTISRDSLSNNFKHLGTLKGYRLGINFYRQNFKGLIFTIKGFYSSVSEKNTANYNALGSNKSYSLEVKSNNPGVGFDIGLALTTALHWKVVDAGLTYGDIKLTKSYNTVNGLLPDEEYSVNKVQVEYSVGTGFILYVIEKYVSLEGTLGFNNITVDYFNSKSGTPFSYTSSQVPVKNAIESGGLSATLQLNIGFPL